MTKAHEISELFRAAFVGDSTFSGVTCLNDIGADNFTMPALVFKVEDVPLNSTATAYDFTLTIHVETTADGADALPNHNALKDNVVAMLFGDARADLVATLAESTTLSVRGWAAAQAAPSIAAVHFRTPVAIVGTVLVL
jgi:hypothetical protein